MMFVIFIATGIVLAVAAALTYKPGSKTLEGKIEESDKFSHDMGEFAAHHQTGKLSAQTEYLLQRELLIIQLTRVEKAIRDALFEKVRTTLEHREVLKLHEVRMELMDTLIKWHKTAGHLGKRPEHIEELEKLLLGGEHGQKLLELDIHREQNTIDLTRMKDEKEITFEFNQKLDEWKRSILREEDDDI